MNKSFPNLSLSYEDLGTGKIAKFNSIFLTIKFKFILIININIFKIFKINISI